MFFKRVIGCAGLIVSVSVVLLGQGSEILSNDKIIELVRAGIGDQVLIPKINSSTVFMDSSQNELLRLKSAGVSDEVILALLERHSKTSSQAIVCRNGQSKLLANTEVKILAPSKITGKNVVTGQKLDLQIAEDVLIDGLTVIKKGSIVRAKVTDARKPGMIGRSGRLSIIIQSIVLTDGRLLKLRAARSGNDGDNFRTMFTLTVLFGAPGLLKHGKNATIAAGTVFSALTDEAKCLSSDTPT